MAWEQIIKKSTMGAQYGSLWLNSPCVVLSRDRISFNLKFCETFSFRKKDVVCVYVDKSKWKLGFKHPTTEADIESGYVLTGDERSTSLTVNCQKLVKRLPDFVRSQALVAHMASGELMIEVVLPAAPEPEQQPVTS